MSKSVRRMEMNRRNAKVVLFNVKYSENLGDGMISEAIETSLSQKWNCKVDVIDVAGRTQFGEQTFRNRSAKLAILDRLPTPIRRRLIKWTVSSKLRAQLAAWDDAIQWADHVIIGGGHLFQDDDLNLPLKIGAALEICARRGVPLSIYAVGVTEFWSDEARALFSRALDCRVASVSVRDALSKENWDRHFEGSALEGADLGLDPVLSETPLGKPVSERSIGLGIMHPRCIARHSDLRSEGFIAWYAEIAARLAAGGNRVALFTNGSREDEVALRMVIAHPAVGDALAEGRVVALDRAKTPRELSTHIESFECLVAHRLHACIWSYVAGIPSVGLGWDDKLESFFDLTGRSEFLVAASGMAPHHIATCADLARAAGIDAGVQQRIAVESRQGLDALGRLVCGTVPEELNVRRSWSSHQNKQFLRPMDYVKG